MGAGIPGRPRLGGAGAVGLEPVRKRPKPGDRMGRPRAEAQRRRGVLGGGDTDPFGLFLQLPWSVEIMDQGLDPHPPMAKSKTSPRPLREALWIWMDL